MDSSNKDGNIAEVNPTLLELSKDPTKWREQRRRAMKEKIFSHKDKQKGDASNNQQTQQGDMHSMSPGLFSSQTVNVLGGDADHAQQEAFILQQILSRKRQREQREKDTPAVAPTAGEPSRVSSQPCELSIKEKLLQKYKTLS